METVMADTEEAELAGAGVHGVPPTPPTPPATTQSSLGDSDPTVSVSIYDLDAIRAALNTSYYFHQAHDLMEGYREYKSRVKPSPMTEGLGRALAAVEGYLAGTPLDTRED